jgi:hypothetical protein
VNYVIERMNAISDVKMVHVSRLKWFVERERPTGLPDFPRAEDPADLHEPSIESMSVPANDDGFSAVDLVPHSVDGGELEVEATPWPDRPVDVVDGVPLYEPERILDVRWKLRKGRKYRQYLVRWKNHGCEYDSWEPCHHLRNCPDVVEAFRSRIDEGSSR